MKSKINKAAVYLPLLSVACCALGITLARLEVVSPDAGLALFILGAMVGVLSMGAAVLVMTLSGTWPLAFLAMVGMLPLIALVGSGSAGLRYPPIFDVSTDTIDPPSFVHAAALPENAGKDLAFPAANAPIIAADYPAVKPLEVPLAAGPAYERTLLLATRIPHWEVTSQDPAQFTFEAEVTSKIFHWKSDVVVRIQPIDDASSRIDVRSRSRHGKADHGENAKRIEAFLAKLRLSPA